MEEQMNEESVNPGRCASRAAICLAALALLAAVPQAEAQARRIGVWNIERLSESGSRGFPELQGPDRLPPRNASDLERIAEYIEDELKVDALMLSEIDADSPLFGRMLRKELGLLPASSLLPASPRSPHEKAEAPAAATAPSVAAARAHQNKEEAESSSSDDVSYWREDGDYSSAESGCE